MPSKYDTDRAFLLEQLRLGATYQELSKIYNVTRQTINYVIKKLGIYYAFQHGTGAGIKRAALNLTIHHSNSKRCPSCGDEKSLSEFSNNYRINSDGERVSFPHGYCKSCVAERVNGYYHNKAGFKEHAREWARANVDKVRTYSRRYYYKHRKKGPE